MFLMKCMYIIIANEMFYFKPKSTLNYSGELGPGIVYHISDVHVEGREKVERAQLKTGGSSMYPHL